MTWVLTFTGRKVFPGELAADDIAIEDIAHHLSMLCRFTGASRLFYSVAEHSVLVADLIAHSVADEPEIELAALLHDAPEAYLSDLATPVKAQIETYHALERAAWWAIAERFGLPLREWHAVKYADLVALAIERRHLIADHPEPWSALEGVTVPRAWRKHIPGCWTPTAAEQIFMNRFHAIEGRRAMRAARTVV
jgi:hypothetical protein